MVVIDYNKSYRKGKILTDYITLEKIRVFFSQPVENIEFVRKKSNNPKIPDMSYAIQPTGMFDFGLSKDIINLLDDKHIEYQTTEAFDKHIECGYDQIDIFDELNYENRYYGIETIEKALENGRGTVLWATGAGKCYGEGTPILKYDGSIEMVENLSIGDELMGPDSCIRVIESLSYGEGELYKIIPNKYSEPVVVNLEHILVLRVTNINNNNKIKQITGPNGEKYKSGELVKISVKDYLKSSKNFKHCTKWHQVGVNFQDNNNILDIPPYLLGFWLGDGCKYNATISKPNAFHAIKEEADKMNWGCKEYFYTGKSCPVISITGGFKNSLRKMNLLMNKHIPRYYLTSSREDREQLLAGLLDSDGSPSNSGWDFSNTNENIIDGTIYLARSLGYSVGFKKSRITKSQHGKVCNSWRVFIGPNTPIKTKIKHSANREINKNTSYTGFKIEKIENGKYFGFSLKGNNRMHLLGDFSVAHNSFLQASLVENIWRNSEKPFKCLIIVPGLNLVSQLLDNFKEYGVNFTYSGWTGGVKGMPLRDTETIICNSENFCNKFDTNQKWIKNVDLLLVDEAHKVSDQGVLSKKIQKITTPHRFGFTGTMPKDKMDEWKVIGTFGPVIYEKHSKELRDEGFLSDVCIKVVKLNHKNPPRMNYKQELKYVYKSGPRHIIVRKIVSKLKNNSLILVNHIEHGMDTLDLLNCIEEKEVYFVHGGMPVEERQEIIKKMEVQDNIICIAMSSIFSTGINIKNLHYILFLVGGKSFIRIIQSIGRGLRLHDSKNKLTLIDICDNLRYSMEHADKRQDYYDEQEIEWKEVEIILP